MKLTAYSTDTTLLRFTTAIILLAHSIPSLTNGGVQVFGEQFLSPLGFGVLGVPVAWAVKLSHVAAAGLLLANKYIVPSCIATIIILFLGIVLVHWQHGWFVVGGGLNGIEYNVLLIAVLVSVMMQRERLSK